MTRQSFLDVKARKAYVQPEEFQLIQQTVHDLQDDPLVNVKALERVFKRSEVQPLLRSPMDPVAVVVVA